MRRPPLNPVPVRVRPCHPTPSSACAWPATQERHVAWHGAWAGVMNDRVRVKAAAADG